MNTSMAGKGGKKKRRALMAGRLLVLTYVYSRTYLAQWGIEENAHIHTYTHIRSKRNEEAMRCDARQGGKEGKTREEETR